MILFSLGLSMVMAASNAFDESYYLDASKKLDQLRISGSYSSKTTAVPGFGQTRSSTDNSTKLRCQKSRNIVKCTINFHNIVRTLTSSSNPKVLEDLLRTLKVDEINETDALGCNALFYASEIEHVRALVEFGCDFRKMNIHGIDAVRHFGNLFRSDILDTFQAASREKMLLNYDLSDIYNYGL